MSAPHIVPFRLVLDIPSNDLSMLEQLGQRESLTVRELLIATLQGELAARAEACGLSYRRGWRSAYHLAAQLQDAISALHAAADAGLSAREVLDDLWPPEDGGHKKPPVS